VRVRDEHEVDVGQVVEFETRVLDALEDLQPLRPDRIDENARAGGLDEKRRVADPCDAGLAFGDFRELGLQLRAVAPREHRRNDDLGEKIALVPAGAELHRRMVRRTTLAAFAGHFAPRLMREALRIYQTQFTPSATLDKPYAMLGMPVVVADTETEAKHLSTTSHQRILALLRGHPLWLKPPVDSMAGLWNIEEELQVKDFLSLAAVGNQAQVKTRLEQLAAELGINEFMFTIDVYDPQKRLRALELLAELKTG